MAEVAGPLRCAVHALMQLFAVQGGGVSGGAQAEVGGAGPRYPGPLIRQAGATLPARAASRALRLPGLRVPMNALVLCSRVAANAA